MTSVRSPGYILLRTASDSIFNFGQQSRSATDVKASNLKTSERDTVNGSHKTTYSHNLSDALPFFEQLSSTFEKFGLSSQKKPLDSPSLRSSSDVIKSTDCLPISVSS